MKIRKGELTLATIAADAEIEDDYFNLYPFGDEDGRYVLTADEAVSLCDGYETEYAKWTACQNNRKRWQFWR